MSSNPKHTRVHPGWDWIYLLSKMSEDSLWLKTGNSMKTTMKNEFYFILPTHINLKTVGVIYTWAMTPLFELAAPININTFF